jgi:integrase
MLRERAGRDVASSTMRLRDLGVSWLELCEQGDLSPQSIQSYRQTFERIVEPGLGGLMVREATVAIVERFLFKLAERTPGNIKAARAVLSGMFNMAVRHGAISTNPMREVTSPKAQQKQVRALSVEDAAVLRRGIEQWLAQPVGKGPKKPGDLLDLFDLLLATGARIGEICAVRWHDVDLTGERATVTISGTVVRTKNAGLIRQGHTKTAAGFRTVTLPRFAVDMLLRRQVEAEPNPENLVFPTRNGTLREPANVRRIWRNARGSTGFDWVTPHTFRKTVATLIDSESGAHDAAAQLGHSRASVTINHYVQRALIAPDASSVLEQLRGDN